MLIKNIHLIKWLDENALLRLEQAALAHQRFSDIHFKIVSVTDEKVVILTTQNKNFHQNQFDAKRLVEITKEVFVKFLDEKALNVAAVPFISSPTEVVDSTWITEQMSRYKIALKQISADTGINKSSLSSVITGDKPLSAVMRGMFYYYFKQF